MHRYLTTFFVGFLDLVAERRNRDDTSTAVGELKAKDAASPRS